MVGGLALGSDELRSWSLGGRDAEAVMGEMEEAPKRRTWRFHHGRPSDSPGAMGKCLPKSRFGFAFILYLDVEYCFPGSGLRWGRVRSRRILRGYGERVPLYVVVRVGHGVCRTQRGSELTPSREKDRVGESAHPSQSLGYSVASKLAYPSQCQVWDRGKVRSH